MATTKSTTTSKPIKSGNSVTYEALMKNLHNKIYHPVYFLYGDESYYIDQVSDYMEQHILSEDEKEFNQTILYGKDVNITSILGAAKRFPMMANYQLVIVKEAQEAKIFPKKGSEDTPKKEDKGKVNPFVAYLENPLKSTILVFCYKYGGPDARTSIGKALQQYAQLLESKKLYDNVLPDWISKYLGQKKMNISPKASALIADHLGSDLSKIAHELDKLMLNLKSTETIDENHVEKFIGISKEYNPFEFTTALGKKDLLKSYRIADFLAGNAKAYPLFIITGNLYGYFTKILQYHALEDKSRGNAASVLKVSPYFLGEYETAARNYSFRKTMEILSILRTYDLQVKGVDTVNMEGKDIMKELVYKILH